MKDSSNRASKHILKKCQPRWKRLLFLSAAFFVEFFALTLFAQTANGPINHTYIDPLSAKSLLLTTFRDGQPIANATGFVVERNGRNYLITNWHVLFGRRPDNGTVMDPQGRVPNAISILHNQKDHLGQWVMRNELLYDPQGRCLIKEHPKGREIDIVALPLTNLDDVQIYATDLKTSSTPILTPTASEISIIGFPMGHASFVGLPIWKTGAVASDVDIDYQNEPEFLVDTTSRPGMSGSPVYARRIGGFLTTSGDYDMVVGISDRFMGIYAGGIDGTSEVGRVWKTTAITTLLESLP